MDLSEMLEIKKLCKGRTDDQQQIIHYFLDERGCLKAGIPDSDFDANKERQIKALNLKNVVVFGVGMTVPSEEVAQKMAEQNQIPMDRFFYFEGGYNPKKVGFFKRMMMNMIKKSIEKKAEKTEEDLHMLETFKGADCTSREAIKPLVELVMN